MKSVFRISLILSLILTTSLLAEEEKSLNLPCKIILQNDRSWDVDQLNMAGDQIILQGGQLRVPASSVEMAEFEIGGISLQQCARLFRAGKLGVLKQRLEEALDPFEPIWDVNLSHNLSPYLFQLLQVQYWNEDYEAAAKTFSWLQSSGDSEYISKGRLYRILSLIGQGEISTARAQFAEVEKPERISAPMTSYIRALLARQKEDSTLALEKLAEIIAFYSRDIKWMPAALYQEASIYLAQEKGGECSRTKSVLRDIELAYPETVWSEKAVSLRKEITHNDKGN